MMSKRSKVSTVKIKSSDGDEFEVGDDVVRELETLKIMTKFSDDLDEDEHVPTCAVKGRSLKKVLVLTEYHIVIKNMDLLDTFDTILTADYLGNVSLSDEMLKKVFHNNSYKVINDAAKEYDDDTILRLLDDFKRRNEVIVTFHQDKLKYFDPSKSQWITLTKIPCKNRSKKKLCVIKQFG